jgi:predicted enzyme involved in methoxymalonyl-ACP biosynthesis
LIKTLKILKINFNKDYGNEKKKVFDIKPHQIISKENNTGPDQKLQNKGENLIDMAKRVNTVLSEF